MSSDSDGDFAAAIADDRPLLPPAPPAVELQLGDRPLLPPPPPPPDAVVALRLVKRQLNVAKAREAKAKTSASKIFKEVCETSGKILEASKSRSVKGRSLAVIKDGGTLKQRKQTLKDLVRLGEGSTRGQQFTTDWTAPSHSTTRTPFHAFRRI